MRPPSPKWATAWQPSLASRAKAGGPGRTRTCNQTVMSGRLSIAFVDFTGFPVGFVCVRCVSVRAFLVRNWCGVEEGGLKRRRTIRTSRLAGRSDARGGDLGAASLLRYTRYFIATAAVALRQIVDLEMPIRVALILEVDDLAAIRRCISGVLMDAPLCSAVDRRPWGRERPLPASSPIGRSVSATPVPRAFPSGAESAGMFRWQSSWKSLPAGKEPT